MSTGYGVTVDQRVFVDGPDGTPLALTLYLPDAPFDGPFPAVLEALPYRKDDDCTSRDWQTFSYLAERGIAGIRLDIRGTGASRGIIEDEYTATEHIDNIAVMEWAAGQDWCNGNLGMWGISWGGFNSLQTAMLRPPRLGAIAVMHATHDRFACDVHYVGGSLHAQEQGDWPAMMVATNALPPDPDIVGEDWFDAWIERLEHTPQWLLNWLRHQHRDSYWMHGSPCADYASIECPTLLVGGWNDAYVDGILALGEHLRCPRRLVVGPWGHERPATGVPGPTLDHFDLLARWFGHHLRGDHNGIMEALPAALVHVADEPTDAIDHIPGRWLALPGWPPPTLERVDLDLSSVGPARARWEGPQWVGVHAPVWYRVGVELTDSTPDDAASIVFETDPLEEPMCLMGAPEVDVTVTSDREFGLVAARLLGVGPDGATRLISRGSRNLVFVDDFSAPAALAPGEAVRVRFGLRACAVTVPAGWRLRLAVSGADFPIVWPPPGRFSLAVDGMSSVLSLPVLPVSGADRVQIPEVASLPAPAATTERSISSCLVERDSGWTTVRRRVGHTEHQPGRGDLTYELDQDWSVTVADYDPLTTRVEAVTRAALARPGWEVAAIGSVSIGSDQAGFTVEIELEATHNADVVYLRSWREVIERSWS